MKKSIITKKFKSIFREKSQQGTLWPCQVPSRRQGLSERQCRAEVCVAGVQHMKFRNSPVNINYLAFSPRWTKLCNIHRGSRKIKLFSPGTGFTGQVFTRNPLGSIHLGHWQSVSPLGWTHFKRTTCGSTLLTYKWKFPGNCSIHVNWTTMKFKFQYWQRFNVINKETRRCFLTYLEDIKTDNVTPERIKYWANLFLITEKGQLNLRHWNSLAFHTSLADIFANFHHRCLMRP